jgi:hypothetical protein
MEFVLTFRQPAQVYRSYADPEKGPAMLQVWKNYMDEMSAAGVLRGGHRVNAAGVTAVRVRNGQPQLEETAITNAPDVLGGYVVIDVPSLEEALKWAAQSPSSLTGSTEVCPVLTTSG